VITRLLHLWEQIRSSLWFVPTCMSLAAGVLAFLSGQLDVSLAEAGDAPPLVYPGDREGARTLLSTVAGSMITVAGVTFSVTVVALSLASSQFGPRLLLTFMRDRGNQLVLGTFIGTFLFCLMALGSAQDRHAPDAVPAVSATIGLLLAIASVAVLIYFIHHVASSIRAEHVIDSVARDLERSVDRLFPRSGEERREAEDAREASEPTVPEALFVPAPRAGYVQRMDESRLAAIAADEDLVLRAARRPGHFVVEGEPLLWVAGREELAPELVQLLQGCFILGRQRSHEQDPEYGIHHLVEVAVRALSPGVNDPYTALSCVDWLGAVLCRVGSRPLRPARRLGPDGRVRFLGDPITFGGMLAASFNQIRQCAQTTPAVSIRMLETLERIGRSVTEEDRRATVRAQADMVFHGALPERLQECDRRDLEARYAAVAEALEPGSGERARAAIAQT